MQTDKSIVVALPFLPSMTGDDVSSLFCSAPHSKTADLYCYYNKSGLVSFSLGRSSNYFRATSYVIGVNL